MHSFILAMKSFRLALMLEAFAVGSDALDLHVQAHSWLGLIVQLCFLCGCYHLVLSYFVCFALVYGHSRPPISVCLDVFRQLL